MGKDGTHLESSSPAVTPVPGPRHILPDSGSAHISSLKMLSEDLLFQSRDRDPLSGESVHCDGPAVQVLVVTLHPLF